MKKSNIYIGEVIKQVIAEKQVTKAELARRLGVKPQSVDYLLTRKSIDTDTLYSLSLALDYDFAVLYSIKKEHALATDEESPFKVGNAKISLEIELRPDEMLKLNLKQKMPGIHWQVSVHLHHSAILLSGFGNSFHLSRFLFL